MISLEDAQHYVRQWLVPLAPIDVVPAESLGCVVADDLFAIEAVPGFINSAMDGYALRSSDTAAGPVRLAVLGSILAGDVAAAPLGAGEAMRIMTGAPLPDGADCVCMIEEVEVDADGTRVDIGRVIEPGECIRRPGDDVQVGQLLARRGVEVGPAQVGVLAGQGFARLSVHPRPRVGVLSTGHELASAGESLGPGQIRDSNRPMLLALLRRSGFVPVDLGTAEDQPAAITARFREGLASCDAIVSTGGVSVGDADHVNGVISALSGDRAQSMRVAIKPGKPFAFGVAGESNTPLFGLAGNPVSTYVGFELLVRPALRLLAGQSELDRLSVNMVLDTPLPRQPDGKLHLVFVIARFHEDGRLHAQSSARRGSHLLNAVADANAIALVPDGPGYDVGETVRTVVLDPESSGAAPDPGA